MCRRVLPVTGRNTWAVPIERVPAKAQPARVRGRRREKECEPHRIATGRQTEPALALGDQPVGKPRRRIDATDPPCRPAAERAGHRHDMPPNPSLNRATAAAPCEARQTTARYACDHAA